MKRARGWRRAGASGLASLALALLMAAPLAAQAAAGDSLWALGEHERARQAYEQALAEDPGAARPLFRLAVLLSWAGRFDSSLSLLQKARLRDPADPEIRLHQAKVLSWAGRYGAAIAGYDSLLADEPGNRQAAMGRAQTLSWAGRFSEADSGFAALLRVDPENLDARAGRGQVASWSGDLEGAERHFQAVLARDSTHLTALNGLAMVRVWQGDSRGASQLSRRAIAVAPADATTRDVAARTRAAGRAQVEVTLGWSHDSDDNTMWWQQVGSGLLVGPGVRLFATGQAAEASDPVRDAERLGGEAGLAVSRRNLTVIGAVGVRRLSPDGAPDRTLGTWRASASIRPTRRSALWLGYSHYSFDETAFLIGQDLDVDDLSAEGNTEIMEGLTLLAGAGLAWYSDDNIRRNAHLLITKRLTAQWSAGVFGRVMGFEQAGVGYFTPDRFLLGEARLAWTWARRGWSTTLGGGLGVQQVRSDGDAQEQWHLEGRLARQFGLVNEAWLSAGVSNSAVSSTTGAFRYYSAQLGARIGL